jgi:putative radical SAM enzyme (TIGR03279 family)
MVRVSASKDKRIPVGATLRAINNREIHDFLEFQFYDDTSKTRIILIESSGKSKRITYEPREKIAITLESPLYRRCDNRCDFCFINGLPGHLRRELYFRDDDYRLSFLFGNFLSLTNVNDHDISRIGRLRLSPLYISVHTTDPKLRVRLFKNKRAGLILEQLKALADNGITLHCQVVVIPGITTGKVLEKTIKDLGQLYPAVASIGIVPVGKTKYVKGFQPVTKSLARSVINTGERFHKYFRKRHSRGLVYIADELYIKTRHPIPSREYYDDFAQYENGIGMVRTLLDEIDQVGRVKRSKGRLLILTGVSAYPYLRILEARLAPNIKLATRVVYNVFLGPTVTVSGLLSARDINQAIKQSGNHYDHVILPANCVNDSQQLIDNEEVTDKRVIIAPHTIKELVKCLQ